MSINHVYQLGLWELLV